MLGVRSPGSGLSQAEAVGLAVGNVPCDGTNPPKYLDAEFTRLQIRDADGAWREAENGAVITVAPGQPVRARITVGNTQAATWRADDRRHAVTLRVREKASGRTLGRHMLPLRRDGSSADVPYLADADFGEIDLFQEEGSAVAVVLPAEVSVQMEVAHQLQIPFGEIRTFTLKARSMNAR